MSRVQIVEVGPRDGLQNEKQKLSLAVREKFITRLVEAGVKRMEVGAFVSPQWVPQMEGSGRLLNKILNQQAEGQLARDTRFAVLVPNLKGMEDALKTGVKEVAIFGACSETFSQKNINCSIAESFARFDQVMNLAKKHKIKVRGYLSTAFGCPYEGEVAPTQVVRLSRKMMALGIYELSIGDTIGVATPKQVTALVKKLLPIVGVKKLAMHFHDTRGTGLANVLASYQLGVRIFDASLGGLGGCPYAQGASGNLATEDLVYMLEGMGAKTGIDLERLIHLNHWMQKQIKRPLPSRVGQAGQFTL